jgi:Family of unknown function (DUF5317)
MVWRRECDLEDRAMKGCMRGLLIPIDSENAGELALAAAQKLNTNKHDAEDDAHRKPLPEASVESPVSRSRSLFPLAPLRFVKETHVWLVWIPLLLLALGIGMNFLAVTTNHGIMPVVLPPSTTIANEDKMHLAATADSRFLFLCDWIHLHATGKVASPGDYLITAGDLLKWPLVWIWVGFSASQSTLKKLIRSPANAELT